LNILFNATTLRKGGPLSRAAHFLLELQNDPRGHTWHLAVSSTLVAELERLGAATLDRLHVFDQSPAQSLRSRRQLSQLADRLAPDCVFTFAGPAYVKFHARHLLGCALGWVTHATWQAYRSASFPYQWIRKPLLAMYQGYWLRQADGWVVQTEAARQGLHRRVGVPLAEIAIVPNSCGKIYLGGLRIAPESRPSGKWRILCFAAPYPHKRLDLVPHVAKELLSIDPALDFEFVLTLPPESRIYRRLVARARALGVTERMYNQGPIPIADGPRLYASSDICFLPTVLETFTATFPEAMAMHIPIVTTDLDFAHDICQDAAIYFQPNNARSAARQLASVIRDKALRSRLVESGEKVLSGLPLPSEQYGRYVELMTKMVARQPLHPFP
jgi:glycosyltransferase involved in cell wall biosynthesis